MAYVGEQGDLVRTQLLQRVGVGVDALSQDRLDQGVLGLHVC